jgi:hypothetical protein
LHNQTALQSEDPHNPRLPGEPIRPGAGRAYMAAPTYASVCQNCHALQFDGLLSDSVPHDKPQVIHEFIVRKLNDYIRQHPEAVHEPARPLRVMFGGTVSRVPQTPRIARNAEEWVRFHTEDAENLLWHKTCQECHTLNYQHDVGTQPEALPDVAPSKIKEVWLPNAVFSHYAHASFNCQSCHTKAISSQESADVLVPSIKTCQECHNGQPTKLGEAENGCFLCHQYHNWKQPREPFSPSHSIDQLRGAMMLPRSGATPDTGAAVSEMFIR